MTPCGVAIIGLVSERRTAPWLQRTSDGIAVHSPFMIVNDKLSDKPGDMNKYIVEFIGTFSLSTVGCTGIGAGAGVIAPLAIGAAFGDGVRRRPYLGRALQSGRYARRADSRQSKPADVVPYWIAQFVAAAVAALLTIKVFARSTCDRNCPRWSSLLAEFLFTLRLFMSS
ncbi:MAG: hypothetical protein Udaeo2_15430 [Candidatus Udaeobacter sp.]|nr:MAG: hypothetical protein Udaeo2_15430 [Candidatus Udaeobacter sp.]